MPSLSAIIFAALAFVIKRIDTYAITSQSEYDDMMFRRGVCEILQMAKK
jgi:hypothetical protein